MRQSSSSRNNDQGQDREAVRGLPPKVVGPVCPDTCSCCVTLSADFLIAMDALGRKKEKEVKPKKQTRPRRFVK